MAQAICSRCYQIFDGKEFEEHRKKKCFALMLKPMDITLRTTIDSSKCINSFIGENGYFSVICFSRLSNCCI